MDKDHRPLPRFADIQAQHPDRNARGESALPERLHESSQLVNSRPEQAPPPLHPPMQSHLVRPEMVYQPSNAARRQHGHPQMSRQHHPERQNPAPIQAYSQPMQAVSNSDRDWAAHSQSPSVDNMAYGVASTQYSTFNRQPQQISVAEGGVTKPKKLHREVEQKRRMRMAEQIVELRKWVSDPNGGRTDKVSVLQDAVTYVKESAKKVEELQNALERSRAECSHLRSLLNKSSPASTLPGPPVHTPPQSHIASVPHLGSAVRHHAHGGVFDEEIHQPSQLTVMQKAYQEGQLHPSVADAPNPQRALGSMGVPSNFAVTPNSSIVMRGAASAQPTAQAFGNRGGQLTPGLIRHSHPELPSLHSQHDLHGGYYETTHAAGRTVISGPSQPFYRSGQNLYDREPLPRLRRENEEQQTNERKSET